MTTTPRSERIHITLFGLRNAGKSSLLNAIAGRTVAIVSEEPGTTTDPVSRAMELGALGPVVLTDTAGLDDEGELGALRVERSLERLSWTDLALFVTPLHRAPTELEEEMLRRLGGASRSLVVVGSFADRPVHPAKETWLKRLADSTAPTRPLALLKASGATGEGVAALRELLAGLGRAREGREAELVGPMGRLGEAPPLEGLVERGDLILLVTPIDSAAPKGRLILPQIEVLRDALDRGCVVLTVQPEELAATLSLLDRPPRLVITDSQAFGAVAAVLPPDQALSSFSILFARKKGELSRFASGLSRVEELARAGDGGERASPIRLLALEACTHNRTHEDIATVKIPRLLAQRSGRKVELSVARELSDAAVDSGLDLAVLCGGCMATRARMLAQLGALEAARVPALNFGLFLAWAHGVFPRAILPLGRAAL